MARKQKADVIREMNTLMLSVMSKYSTEASESMVRLDRGLSAEAISYLQITMMMYTALAVAAAPQHHPDLVSAEVAPELPRQLQPILRRMVEEISQTSLHQGLEAEIDFDELLGLCFDQITFPTTTSPIEN